MQRFLSLMEKVGVVAADKGLTIKQEMEFHVAKGLANRMV